MSIHIGSQGFSFLLMTQSLALQPTLVAFLAKNETKMDTGIVAILQGILMSLYWAIGYASVTATLVVFGLISSITQWRTGLIAFVSIGLIFMGLDAIVCLSLSVFKMNLVQQIKLIIQIDPINQSATREDLEAVSLVDDNLFKIFLFGIFAHGTCVFLAIALIALDRSRSAELRPPRDSPFRPSSDI